MFKFIYSYFLVLVLSTAHFSFGMEAEGEKESVRSLEERVSELEISLGQLIKLNLEDEEYIEKMLSTKNHDDEQHSNVISNSSTNQTKNFLVSAEPYVNLGLLLTGITYVTFIIYSYFTKKTKKPSKNPNDDLKTNFYRNQNS